MNHDRVGFRNDGYRSVEGVCFSKKRGTPDEIPKATFWPSEVYGMQLGGCI